MENGVLSQFLAAWTPDFYGGEQVQELEREWETFFQVKHAISMNSATSGLFAAIGASGVGPGDEVIVSPYTMSASAACVLAYNAIPVFADIDPESYCLTAETIRAAATERTRAVVVVDLFGYPANFDPIMDLAKSQGWIVIEDAAQAAGAHRNGRLAGTLADIGVFSLNYHKIIHCGEGGIVVTDNDRFAERLCLIRNHAEVVIAQKGSPDLVNMLGFNYRLSELHAAIAREQLKKLPGLIQRRFDKGGRLTEELCRIEGIQTTALTPEIVHAFYVYPFQLKGIQKGRFARKRASQSLRAEGIPVAEGYVQPIYLQPLYQKQELYGGMKCPFQCPWYGGHPRYQKGICPETERLHEKDLLYGDWCHDGISNMDIDDIVLAVAKVIQNINLESRTGDV